MTDQDKNDEETLKKVEFYSAGVTAWFNSSFEHDKSILTLSASGIALLVTLLTTVGARSPEAVVLYILSVVSFLVSLFSILAVFNRNKAHIEQVFNGNSESDPVLTFLDKVAIRSFCIGVLLAAIIGIASSVSSVTKNQKETCMSEEKSTKGLVNTNESFNNMANISPKVPLKDSVNSVGKLQPPVPTPPASPPATSPATQEVKK